jgi:hypothetical protein
MNAFLWQINMPQFVIDVKADVPQDSSSMFSLEHCTVSMSLATSAEPTRTTLSIPCTTE